MVTEYLPNWLRQRAELTPKRVAIEFEEVNYTFAELDQMAEEMAEKIAYFGVKQGDSCAILLRNHIDSVVMIHALFYLGVQVVMLNHKLTAKELTWQIQDSQATTLLTEQAFCEKLAVMNQALSIQIVKKEELSESVSIHVKRQFALNETATIMYTSGTTGHPKGVIQTYGNHWWSAIGSVLNLGLHEEDCWYCVVPIFHISGLSILMKNVIYGMKIILDEKFEANRANKQILENGVTIMSLVSTMLNRMVHSLGDDNFPSTFRGMLLGGGPAPLSLLEECRRRKISVFQTYGMTETASQIVTLAPEYSIEKIGSAGKPLFPSQLRIKVNDREAKPGEAGEIIVFGPNVTKGYFNRPDATAEAIKDGWLYTGDIGYVDKEGFLYVLDRRSDLIISGGENIYPAEIEAVLSSHPAIFEAGVTGIPNDKWGQVPIAFVVLKEAVSESELIGYCREQLAAYKIPHRIMFCNELPRNGTNKLLRRKLRELYGDGQ